MKEKVTIVGSGLTGSLLAIYLSRRQFSINLFEKRPDPRKTELAAGRSINLAISHRGISALKKLGIDQTIMKDAIPMTGRYIHGHNGEKKIQQYGRTAKEYINAISRNALNKNLLEIAQKEKNIEIHFNQTIQQVDLHKKIIQTEHDSHHYNYLIGTDGSASAIRNEFIKRPHMNYSQEYENYGYKELLMPADGSQFALEKNYLHIWPRKAFMLIGLPNPDGSFTLTLFLALKGKTSFASLQDPDSLRSFFKQEFPDAFEKIPNLNEQFFSHPTGHLATIRCYPWHFENSCLLMGDAAHGIVPFYGQGMNCCFEDCEIFDQIIASNSNKPLGDIFKLFGEKRKPDADAIADLARANFIEMRDLVGSDTFLKRKQIEQQLMEKYPERYISQYVLVTFTSKPYLYAQKVGQLQDRLFDQLIGENSLNQNLIDNYFNEVDQLNYLLSES